MDPGHIINLSVSKPVSNIIFKPKSVRYRKRKGFKSVDSGTPPFGHSKEVI